MVDAKRSPVTGVAAPERDVQEQFSDFFRAHFKRVVQLIILLDGNVHEAEDAAMHAFQDAYAHWETIRHPAAWVRKAAHRKFIKDRTRDRDRQQRALKSFRQPNDDEPLAPHEDLLVQWQELDWVNKVLECLPNNQRNVMACIVDGMSTAEIADLLGKNEANVRSHLRHARKRLQERLTIAASYSDPGHMTRPSASTSSTTSQGALRPRFETASPEHATEEAETGPSTDDVFNQVQPGSRKGATR